MKTTDLSNIMRMAWRFYRTTHESFSECLKLAWRNFRLVRRMSKSVVRFFFQKLDGSIREAFGTLRSDMVPPVDENRKKNETVQVFFDTEKQSWRSFRCINLLSVE